MRKIEVKVLQEPQGNSAAPFLARLTQRGHEIKNMGDLIELWNKPASEKFKQSLSTLPHGTIKRFDTYTVAIVGASRRFLAQIRTHQLADFVSGSLQYSDWSSVSDPDEMFVVPYEMYGHDGAEAYYLDGCARAFNKYKTLSATVDNDSAGYIMPNGIRNVLIMQANVQEWQYILGLRTCRRNTSETRYVMLRIWEELLKTEDGKCLFTPASTGCFCQKGRCMEGHMTCGDPIDKDMMPSEIIARDFPLIRG